MPLRRDPVQEDPLMPTLYVSDFPSGSLVKNPPANARDAGEESSIPGSGRSLEEEMATYSSILAWEIPQTEEPGGAIVHGVAESQIRLSEYFYDTFIKVSKLDGQSFKNSIRITTKSLDLGMSRI